MAFSRKKYLAGLPRKRMGAGVIFFNNKEQVLIINPVYKDHWSIPGGVVEKNESPRQAGERETLEETNLQIKIKQLISVSYNFPSGEDDESLQWLFFGGVLTPEQIGQIKLDPKELSEFKFVDPETSGELAGRAVGKTITLIREAIKNKKPVYLENWEEVKNA